MGIRIHNSLKIFVANSPNSQFQETNTIDNIFLKALSRRRTNDFIQNIAYVSASHYLGQQPRQPRHGGGEGTK